MTEEVAIETGGTGSGPDPTTGTERGSVATRANTTAVVGTRDTAATVAETQIDPLRLWGWWSHEYFEYMQIKLDAPSELTDWCLNLIFVQKVKQKLTKHPCNRKDSCTLLYWRPKIFKNLVEAAVTENTFNWICHFVYQQGSFFWICWVSHTHLASDHQRIQVDFNFFKFCWSHKTSAQHYDSSQWKQWSQICHHVSHVQMSLMESGCFESPTEQQICSWHLSWVVDGFASTCTLQLWPPPWGALQLPLNICPDWQRQGCSVTSAPDPTIYPDKPSSLPNPAPSCCCSPPPFFFLVLHIMLWTFGGEIIYSVKTDWWPLTKCECFDL